MPDSLETAALNGSLFTFDPTPPSPTRSASSTSPVNTDDELGSDLSDNEASSSQNRIGKRGDTSGRGVPSVRKQIEHDGPQTGPKGVIQDCKARNQYDRQIQEKQLNDKILEQNRNAIIGLTIHEEDILRKKEKEEQDELDEWRKKRKDQLRNGDGVKDDDEEENGDGYGYGDRRESVKRGGLRELGKEGFVNAVEQVGWVVVLIYEPEIPRCTSLLASLLHLSLNLPSSSSLVVPITLYKARATSLEFSLLPPTSSVATVYQDEEPKGKPDPDVLPTLLVYKNGELEKTWIRVDWEVDQSGVEGLLRREGILPHLNKPGVNRRNLIDDDDDE